jgi:hypothetical protein
MHNLGPIILPDHGARSGMGHQKYGPRKAPGTDGTTTYILQKLLPQLKAHLAQLRNSRLALQYRLKHFRQSTTVALPKLGNRDHTTVKAHRLTALLNTLGKGLEAVVAQRIAFAVEKHQLLPKALWEEKGYQGSQILR